MTDAELILKFGLKGYSLYCYTINKLQSGEKVRLVEGYLNEYCSLFDMAEIDIINMLKEINKYASIFSWSNGYLRIKPAKIDKYKFTNKIEKTEKSEKIKKLSKNESRKPNNTNEIEITNFYKFLQDLNQDNSSTYNELKNINHFKNDVTAKKSNGLHKVIFCKNLYKFEKVPFSQVLQFLVNLSNPFPIKLYFENNIELNIIAEILDLQIYNLIYNIKNNNIYNIIRKNNICNNKYILKSNNIEFNIKNNNNNNKNKNINKEILIKKKEEEEEEEEETLSLRNSEIVANQAEPAINEKGFRFAEWFKSLLPDTRKKRITKQDLNNWANEFPKIIKRTGMNEKELAELCIFARQDDFWGNNFFSPLKLLKKTRNNELYIYESIQFSMKRNGKLPKKRT